MLLQLLCLSRVRRPKFPARNSEIRFLFNVPEMLRIALKSNNATRAFVVHHTSDEISPSSLSSFCCCLLFLFVWFGLVFVFRVAWQ